jgi:putative ATP-dependent endonuclease of OLD family
MGVNFNQQGIRVVECAQAGGPGIFIKAADALGVKWHVVADNDEGGHKYIKSAKSLLRSRPESNYISKLTSSNTDILLCINGYGLPYLNGVPPNKKREITEPVDTEAYWNQVYKIIKNQRGFSKPAAAIESIDLIRTRGTSAVPDEIATIIKKLVKHNRGENC